MQDFTVKVIPNYGATISTETINPQIGNAMAVGKVAGKK